MRYHESVYPVPWLRNLSFTICVVFRHVIMMTTRSQAIVKALESMYKPKPVVAGHIRVGYKSSTHHDNTDRYKNR